MTTVTHVQRTGGHRHSWLYAALGVAFAILLVVGLFTYDAKRETIEAQDKAAQVIDRWEAEGFPTPANDELLVRVLGTDGGALCTTAHGDLTQAFLAQQLANGAAGPGQRAVIVSKRALEGARIMVEVYCPERLEAYDDFVAGLRFDDVVRG